MAAGGLTAAFVVTEGVALTSSASAATASDFSRLRACESSGNYRISTGNGYYGAYQFDLSTWRGLGYGGYPHQAAPATQDAAARRLQAARGWQPWPACSRKLGLTSSSRTTEAASRSSVRSPATFPAFRGHVLSTADRSRFRYDVRTWQRRMAQRGWDISADGYFGPRSARVAQRFAVEKGIASGRTGKVDRAMWNAAWRAPVR